jgi:nitrate reductase NapE component
MCSPQLGHAQPSTPKLCHNSWITLTMVVFVLAVGIGGFGYAIWSAFVDKPRKLDQEAKGLTEIANDLSAQI